MIAHDPILSADRAEEMEARMSLRMARDPADLMTAWYINCDHFDGEQREKLQGIYDECLAKIKARLS